MDGYLTRRLVTAPLLLLGLSFVLFLVFYVRWPQQAVSCFDAAASSCGMVDEEAKRWLERFGLDDPWYERYGVWLWDALRGNLSESFYPPYEMGRIYLLPTAAIMSIWGLCVLGALARDIRKPRPRIDAHVGERASARRLRLLAISAA